MYAFVTSFSSTRLLRSERQCTANRCLGRPATTTISSPGAFTVIRKRGRLSTRGARETPTMVFTGIVEEIGTVSGLERTADGGTTLGVKALVTLQEVALGDSVSVNGTCLTVTDIRADGFSFGLAPETLRRTNLGDLSIGSTVNLERSLAANGRLGGHIVQGHVDTTGEIRKVERETDSIWFTIGCEPSFMKYIVSKGYIAIDGTSLTVCDVYDDSFTFMMIPFTQENVAIPSKAIGDRVNLEVDITAKYIEKLLAHRS